MFQRLSGRGKDVGTAAETATGDAVPLAVTEEAKKKAQAAKSYIENMYKLQHENVRERFNR